MMKLIFCTTAVLLLSSTFAVSNSQAGEISHHKQIPAGDHSCRTREDCFGKIGLRSVCNSYGRCLCQLGFTEVLKQVSIPNKNGNGTSSIFTPTCEHLDCKGLSSHCMLAFGVWSHCDQVLGSCRCDPGYLFDVDKGRCVNANGNDDPLYTREVHANYLLIGLIVAGCVSVIVLVTVIICCALKRKGRVITERQQSVARDRAAYTAQQKRQNSFPPPPSAPNPPPNPQNPGAYI